MMQQNQNNITDELTFKHQILATFFTLSVLAEFKGAEKSKCH